MKIKTKNQSIIIEMIQQINKKQDEKWINGWHLPLGITYDNIVNGGLIPYNIRYCLLMDINENTNT